jgi:hypothetical protein
LIMQDGKNVGARDFPKLNVDLSVLKVPGWRPAQGVAAAQSHVPPVPLPGGTDSHFDAPRPAPADIPAPTSGVTIALGPFLGSTRDPRHAFNPQLGGYLTYCKDFLHRALGEHGLNAALEELKARQGHLLSPG